MERLPEAWRDFLAGRYDAVRLGETLERVERERSAGSVFPPSGELFRAFRLTPPDAVRVVLLGQDPYHDDGQAQGLAFSVPPGLRFPPSLRNIFKEYAADLGRPVPESGSLEGWARGGVLLLNSVLSVRAHAAASHAKLGWQTFTDAVIGALSERASAKRVFLLWGNYAMAKRPLIDEERHTVVAGVHPSPLSASRGFFGSRPFSQAEQALPGWRWPEL